MLSTSGGHSVTKRHATCPTRPDPVGTEEKSPDMGVDSVRTQNQVVSAGGAVVERDGDGPVLLAEPLERNPHPDWHGIIVRRQYRVEAGSV